MRALIRSTDLSGPIHEVSNLGRAKQIASAGNFWKAVAMGQKYFNPLSNLGLCALGFKELFIDKLVKPGTPPCAPSNNRIVAALQWLFNLISQDSPTHLDRIQHMAHGAFYLGSGACGMAYGLNVLKVIELGIMAPVFNQLSSGLFMMASLLSLEIYIKSFLEASRVANDGTSEERAKAAGTKQSAVLGMLNSISYIFMSSWIIMGFSSAIALLAGCLGAFFGIIKILYDLYCAKQISFSQ